MDPSRWQRLQELFATASALGDSELAAFLERECAGDAAMRAELESLLGFRNEGFLAAPAPVETVLEADARGAPRGATPAEDDHSASGAASVPQIEGYELGRRLGAGGMGEVWAAEQLGPLRRPVAIKVIRSGLGSEEVLLRFEVERRALALMSHPSIATVFDSGVTLEGLPYFAMELVEGESITEFCDHEGLGLEERLQLFVAVCHGVEHAHERGVVHRDLKPANILVTRIAARPIPKIIDFGIAKALSQKLTEQSLLTLEGQVVGTPSYMSPEQAWLDPTAIDERTDVYSLGVVLFELLVGETPLGGLGLEATPLDEVFRHIRETESRLASQSWRRLEERVASERARARHSRPATIAQRLRGDLDWIVQKALAKDPERRYASPLELGRDLERSLRHDPVLAGPPSWSYRLAKFARKHRGLVGATAAVLSTLLLGLAVSTYLYLEAEDRLERIRQLQVIKEDAELTGYEVEVDRLWPLSEAKIPDFERWLRAVGELGAKRGPYLAVRRELAARAPSLNALERERLAALERLLPHLEEFFDPGKGLVREIDARVDFARSIRRRSIDEKRAAWAAVTARLAAPAAQVLHGKLALAPQLGLVPLGPDPSSGLEEFAHLASGEPPARGEGGELEFGVDSGIVLVLLPGGECELGSRGVVGDGSTETDELPLRRLRLAPFFLSKYEVTQAQWLRLAGSNPSNYAAGGPQGYDLLQPVEKVSWKEAIEILARYELGLPTEAQWEYAARAGSEDPWFCGRDPRALAAFANLADEALAARPGHSLSCEDWNDGHAVPAPVGRLRANGFGLHDTAGNVAEWCREVFGSYANASFEAASGERQGGDGTLRRVVRGGHWQGRAREARSADRAIRRQEDRLGTVGLRAQRAID